MSSSSRHQHSPLNVLIIGATGVIGTYITEAIVTHKHEFGRVAVLTSKKTVVEKVREICALESWGVEVFVGDLEDETRVKDAYRGINTIVSCVGRAGIEKQISLIKWAAESSIKRFYTSEYGTDIEYWPERSAHEPPHQLKLKIRNFMQEVQQWSGIEHTYLVTGPYSDLYFGPFTASPEVGSFNVRAEKAVLLGSGDEEVSFTAMEDVGKFVVAALLHPDVSKNATLIVHSFTATPHDILAEYERQTNSKWEVAYTSLDRLKEMERNAYQIHQPIATVITLRRIWTEGGTLYKFYDDHSLLDSTETETLEDQVRASIQRQMNDPSDAQNNPLRRLSSF